MDILLWIIGGAIGLVIAWYAINFILIVIVLIFATLVTILANLVDPPRRT